MSIASSDASESIDTGERQPGGQPWLARLSARNWGLLAVVVGGATLIGAFLQPLIGDPFAAKFPNLAWWIYPVESHGYQRLQFAQRDFNAICATDRGDKLWVGGEGAAIAASTDGGRTWAWQSSFKSPTQASLDLNSYRRRVLPSNGESDSSVKVATVSARSSSIPGARDLSRMTAEAPSFGTTTEGRAGLPVLRTASFQQGPLNVAGTQQQSSPKQQPPPSPQQQQSSSQQQKQSSPQQQQSSPNKNKPASFGTFPSVLFGPGGKAARKKVGDANTSNNNGPSKKNSIKKVKSASPNQPAPDKRPPNPGSTARSIAGYVRTPNGDPIAGANVHAFTDGVVVGDVTKGDGSYSVINLQDIPGFDVLAERGFDFVAEKNGYEPEVHSKGGPTWTTEATDFTLDPISNSPSEDLVGIHFADGQKGWAIGKRGLLLATTDGGNTWQTGSVPFDQLPFDRAKLTSPSGIRSAQFSDQGVLRCSVVKPLGSAAFALGSTLWNTVEFVDEPRSVFFLGEQGWLASEKGMSRTTDGGKHWTDPDGLALNAVTFVDPLNGWAVGEPVDKKGVILRTTDGGVSWSPQRSGTACRLNAVYFLDGKHGWVAGSNGTILTTTDGGEEWVHITQGTERPNPLPLGESSHWPPPISTLGVVLSLALAVQAARAARAKPPEPEKGVADVLVSDKPLEAGDADVLDLNSIALGLSRFLRNKRTIPPLTIAITGEWGTGKSSLMNLVRADLRSYEFRPVWFNAWHHQKEEHLLASLLQCVRLQAVPQWWRPGGIAFRFRLLSMRGRRHWVPWLLLLLIFSVFAGHELNHGHGSIWDVLDSVRRFKPTDLYSFVQTIPTDTGMFGFIVALLGVTRTVWKGATAFGMNPGALIAGMSSGTRLRDLEAQTSYRQKFAQEFRDVTSALRARKMLILIDDLDRCRPEQVLEVLEAINFLVSSGECFVVIGMARGRVEGCVGLSFKDVAAELIDDKEPLPTNQGTEFGKKKRREFARQYLDKLINIEVPVPTPDADQSSKLLRARKKAPPAGRHAIVEWAEKVKPRAEMISGPLTAIVICAITISGGYLLGRDWPKNPSSGQGQSATPPAASPPGANADTASTASTSANTSTPPAQGAGESSQVAGISGKKDTRNEKTGEVPGAEIHPRRTATPFAPPDDIIPASPSAKRPLGYGLIPIALAFCVLVALYVSNRKPDLIVEDSPEFEKALEIWHPLVVAKDNTPRGMKRFVNRVRYLAMREQLQSPSIPRLQRMVERFGLIHREPNKPLKSQADHIPESMIVALTAIHTCSPDWLKDGRVFALPLASGDELHWPLLQEVKAKHEKEFHNWDQIAPYRRRFVEIASGVRVN